MARTTIKNNKNNDNSQEFNYDINNNCNLTILVVGSYCSGLLRKN
jgi:hypothetical protein